MSVKVRSLEFSYILKHNPNKLQLNNPVRLWLKLDELDKDTIAKADYHYRDLHTLEALKEKDKIRLSALRQRAAAKITQTQAFADMAMANKDKLAAINSIRCGK